MKRPNRKLLSSFNKIEMGVYIVILIVTIIMLLYIFDNIFPAFKYSVLCLKIITWIFLISSLAILLVMIRKTQEKHFHSFSNRKRILYSFSYLSFSLLFLFSIEYLIYIDNKEFYNIEKKYITNSVIDKTNKLQESIAYCDSMIYEYRRVYRNIAPNSYIPYTNCDDIFYTCIGFDTIQIHLNRIPNSGTVMYYNRFNKRNRLFHGVREVGISLKNESYSISHPSNKAILESMKSGDSINGKHLLQLVKENIQFYNNRINSYNKVLNDELTISFWDFVIYNMFNSNITGNKTHIFIRLIFLLQAIVITFFSGYIYQTLYKMLDGENTTKPER